MYFFQSIFLISILFLFVNFTYSEGTFLANIREKGSSSQSTSNLTANATNRAFFSANNTPNTSSLYHPNVSSSLQVASEGGGIMSSTAGAHNGKENTLEHPQSTTVISKANERNNSLLTIPQIIKPVQESVISNLDITPQQDTDKKSSKPKKGVTFHLESQSSSVNVTNKVKVNATKEISMNVLKKVTDVILNHNTSSNATVIHKKPIVTEADSDFINMSNSKEAVKSEAISVDQMDPLLADKKSNRSDYIVPIVAVILSVPLVAILASILYKRGTDWWQHRNYKRMDFLIEGMYHH